jgi:hypothetical protein
MKKAASIHNKAYTRKVSPKFQHSTSLARKLTAEE